MNNKHKWRAIQGASEISIGTPILWFGKEPTDAEVLQSLLDNDIRNDNFMLGWPKEVNAEMEVVA